MEQTLIAGLRGAREAKQRFVVAACRSVESPGPERDKSARLAAHVLACASGVRVHTLQLSGLSEPEVRSSFVQAVCSGASILALGLEDLRGGALEAAVAGLSSIEAWNPKARALALCARPMAQSQARGAWIVACPVKAPRHGM